MRKVFKKIIVQSKQFSVLYFETYKQLDDGQDGDLLLMVKILNFSVELLES